MKRISSTLIACLAAVVLVASAAPALAANGTGSSSTTSSQNDMFKVDDKDREANVPTSAYEGNATTSIAEMEDAVKTVEDLRKKAATDKDAVRLSCINDKLNAMKGMLRISQDAKISMMSALSAGSNENARYQYAKIRVSARKVKELLNAANSCTGAEASYTGKAVVEMTEAEWIAKYDPYYGNPDFFFTPADQVVNGGSNTVGGRGPTDTQPPPASSSQGTPG